MNTVVHLVDFLAKACIYDILPSHIRKLTGFSLRNFHKQLDKLNTFMRDKVEEHKKTYNTKAANNFVDAWLTVSARYTFIGTCLFICQDTSTRRQQNEIFSAFKSSCHLLLPF